MELTWSPDYCLACDRQIANGAYCSQSCRIADQESSSTGSSPQTSPSTSTFPKTATSTAGFYLTPAIDWSAYKTPHSGHHKSGSYSSDTVDAKDQSLSASASRSSLSSSSSTSTQQTRFSDGVHTQLRAYTNAFDTTRNRSRGWSS